MGKEEQIEGYLTEAGKELKKALSDKEKTGVPFFSGTLPHSPAIRPSSLPLDFPPPPEWKDEHYLQVFFF